MKTKLALGILIISIFSLLAFKHAEAEKEEIISALKGLKEFYVQKEVKQFIDYEMYEDHEANKMVSKDSGLVIVSPKGKYATISGIESLTTQEQSVAVDHAERAILVSNHLIIPDQNPVNPLDSISYEDYDLEKISTKLHKLIYKTIYGDIETVEVFYDPETFEISQLLLFYRREIPLNDNPDDEWVKPLLKIKYETAQIDTLDLSKLEMSHYVLKRNGQYVPTENFDNFQIIDNTITSK